MDSANVRVEIADSIATLTIDRPAVRNALDLATVNECHEALRDLAASSDVGVLIVTGAGTPRSYPAPTSGK
jgi:enoyl-CoA hydratase/carnithine racemase